jgi:hypothetical protein
MHNASHFLIRNEYIISRKFPAHLFSPHNLSLQNKRQSIVITSAGRYCIAHTKPNFSIIQTRPLTLTSDLTLTTPKFTMALRTFTMALLCLFMQAVSVVALPLSAGIEPPVVTKVAISTGTPFIMASNIPTPALLVRQWDTPAASIWTPNAPAWTPAAPAWTPATQSSWAPSPIATIVVTAPPTPTPSYTWAETHDDSKNTNISKIIGFSIGGGILGIAFLFAIYGTIRYKCCAQRRKKKCSREDVEAGKIAAVEARENGYRSSEDSQQPSALHAYVMSTRNDGPIVQPPANTHQQMTRMSRVSDGTFVNVPL